MKQYQFIYVALALKVQQDFLRQHKRSKNKLKIPEAVKLIEIVNSIMRWSDNNIRDFAWRKGFSPYRVFVAEMMLRRTTASAVQRIYEKFIETYPDLQQLSNADPIKLERNLETLGYHKFRARFIKETANVMYSTYGKVPNSMTSLLSIKQIGPYIAGAIMSLGFDNPVPMVDTNVLRIFSRIYGKNMTQEEGFNMLKNVLPQDFKRFNLGLLDFGATICRYRIPLCTTCPLRTYCSYASESHKTVS